jgi:hypothetical protein
MVLFGKTSFDFCHHFVLVKQDASSVVTPIKAVATVEGWVEIRSPGVSIQ